MYEFLVFSFFSNHIDKKRLSISNCIVALLYIKLTGSRKCKPVPGITPIGTNA